MRRGVGRDWRCTGEGGWSGWEVALKRAILLRATCYSVHSLFLSHNVTLTSLVATPGIQSHSCSWAAPAPSHSLSWRSIPSPLYLPITTLSSLIPFTNRSASQRALLLGRTRSRLASALEEIATAKAVIDAEKERVLIKEKERERERERERETGIVRNTNAGGGGGGGGGGNNSGGKGGNQDNQPGAPRLQRMRSALRIGARAEATRDPSLFATPSYKDAPDKRAQVRAVNGSCMLHSICWYIITSWLLLLGRAGQEGAGEGAGERGWVWVACGVQYAVIRYNP